MERDLKLWVRKQIGPIATPDFIQFAPGLPKTRSGKIMRRILRKIAANEHEELGDTTTLADPSVVKSLVNNRKNGLYCYVTLNAGENPTGELERDLKFENLVYLQSVSKGYWLLLRFLFYFIIIALTLFIFFKVP